MRREMTSHTLADIAARVATKSSPAAIAVGTDWFARRYADRRTTNPRQENHD